MNFLSLLTLIFIVLKLVEVISWSWWLVLAPSIFQISIVLIILVIAAASETKRDNSWRLR